MGNRAASSVSRGACEGICDSLGSARHDVNQPAWQHVQSGLHKLRKQADYLYRQATKLSVHPDLVKKYRRGDIPELA